MNLSDVAGGGDFKPTFFSGTQVIGSFPQGTVLTLTAPAGKKVRLTALGLIAGQAEPNVSIITDTGTVVSNLTLQGSATATANTFAVGSIAGGVGGGAPNATYIPYIESRTTITITRSGGSSSSQAYYSYAYGD